MRLSQLRTLTLLLLLFLAVPSAQAAVVHFSAAASLRDCLDELSDGFARKNPGVSFVKNYGASGSLAQQLQNGAPVDLFISANEPWIAYLRQKHLLCAGTVADFAYNTLVFVGRSDTRAASIRDLLKLDRIAIGSPRSVPAGEYAIGALKKAYIDRQLARKLVMAKDARACLMYAERGEVDGALVYRTDALQARRSRILFSVPQELYGRVTYPMALTVAGARNASAKSFYQYLQGAEAKSIVARYGFSVP